MIRIFLLTAMVFYVSQVVAQADVMIWSDEFDTPGPPNPTFWNYDLGNGENGWGNHEMEFYTKDPRNVVVQDGMLLIVARKNAEGWTSARLKSEGKINFTYGRIQFKAMLPEGAGTWPALWLLGANVGSKGWPACGEIDVMEHVGRNAGIVQSAMHTPSSFGNTINKGATSLSSFHTSFHIYEANWTPDQIEFSVDGEKYYTYRPSEKNSATWPYDLPQFLIMNVAIGGGFGSDPKLETGGLKNGVDPSITVAEMRVDYVRVYQSQDQLKIEGPASAKKNQPRLTYRIIPIPGATFEWSLPAGARITSGAGTHEITVTWGQTSGTVSLLVTTPAKTFKKSCPVSIE